MTRGHTMHYTDFSSKLENIFFLRNLKNILYWDSLFSTPIESKSNRYVEIAVLEQNIQKLLGDPELEEFCLSKEIHSLDSWETSNIAQFKNFKINECLSDNLAAKFSVAANICENAWRSAKENNDFNAVIPAFENLLDSVKQIAEERSSRLGVSPYEALMHKYDPGRSLEEQKNIFEKLKSEIKFIIPKNSKIRSIDPLVCVHKDMQIVIIKDIIKILDFDFVHGRVDVGSHPFCGGCPGDTRLIIKVEDNFFENLLNAIHETGHGLYEQNLPLKYQNQPVGKARGLVFHEASSLFFEMQIARSESFSIFLAGYLNDKWDIKLDPGAIYERLSSCNVAPIRLGADEVSYHYHIIIRFEIEVELLSGNIKVRDIPQIWQEKYRNYLNIEVESANEGCLQDLQWFRGMFGYFPSYTNGAIISNMIFDRMRKKFPYLAEEIGSGDFDNMVKYLRDHFWSQGSKYDASQTLHHVTNNNKLDVELYSRYLHDKYKNNHINQ